MHLLLSTIGVSFSMSIAGVLGAIAGPALLVLFMLVMPYAVPALGVVTVGLLIGDR